MKIGRRIAFYYMWVTLGITGALVVVFYFYTSRYIDNVYYSYLAEKALVTAGKHWERDEVSAQDYALIQKRYNELLGGHLQCRFDRLSQRFAQTLSYRGPSRSVENAGTRPVPARAATGCRAFLSG